MHTDREEPNVLTSLNSNTIWIGSSTNKLEQQYNNKLEQPYNMDRQF